VLALLGVGLVVMGGQFTVFTYITPFLINETAVAAASVSVFLLVYGVAASLGTFAGGRAADRAASAVIAAGTVVVALALLMLYLVRSLPVPVAVAMTVWGLAGFGLVPSLQYRVVSLAGAGADLAATLGASAVNAGIAAGSLAGGWAIASHGAAWVVLLGTVVCAAASPAAWATGLLRAPGAQARDGGSGIAGPPVTRAAEAACRNCRLSGRMRLHLLAGPCPQGASPNPRPAERHD
jgi:MFS transporter, DHA1 family, inner membrane transport protein